MAKPFLFNPMAESEVFVRKGLPTVVKCTHCVAKVKNISKKINRFLRRHMSNCIAMHFAAATALGSNIYKPESSNG
jgi:hypothetical protein